MNDGLSVELEITDGKASVALDKFRSKIVSTDAELKKLSGGETFASLESNINRSIIQASNLRQELRNVQAVTVGHAGLDGLGQAATRAFNQVTATRNRLSDIQLAMARTTDAKVLNGLINDAKIAEAELDRLQTKINRVAAGRSAAAQRQAAAGSSGSGGYGALAGAAAFLPPEVGIGLDAATAAGIGAGSLALLGSLAAAGVVLVKISQNIREEAEKRLSLEERIQGAVNKQILALKDVKAQAAKQLSDADSDREFDRELKAYKTFSDELLSTRKKTLEQLLDLTQDPEKAKGYTKELLGIKSIQAARPDEKVDAANKAFDDRYEAYKKEQKDFEESVEKGNAKVKELGETYRSTFDSLYQRSRSDNPFALFLERSSTETEKLKESLKGLSPELQKTALAMHAAADSKELFSLRLNNALSVVDLTSEARRFSDPTQGELQKRLDRDRANFEAGSNSTNSDVFSRFQSRQKQIEDFEKKRRQQSLQEQYDEIYKYRPGFDQATADRTFAKVARGANPEDLTNDLRREASRVNLSEAARLAAADKQAENDLKEERAVRKKLLQVLNKLTDTANESGLAGVKQKLEVTFKDETSGGITAKKISGANSNDVADYYFNGLDLVGGSNR